MSLTATTQVTTATSARYIGRLCRHFAHKLPVSYDEQRGRIELPFGLALLAAEEDGLRLRVEAASPQQLGKLREVVASHFERFAWREALTLDWQ